MKAKSQIHKNPDELQAQSLGVVSAKVEEGNVVLKSIDFNLKNPVAMVTGLQSLNDKQRDTNEILTVLGEGIENQPKPIVQKLEEVKSASLITNMVLKRIESHVSREPQPFPEIKVERVETDLSMTNILLESLVAEVKNSSLTTNIELKGIGEKEEVDMSPTNKLLAELIREIKKPCDIKLTLKLK